MNYSRLLAIMFFLFFGNVNAVLYQPTPDQDFFVEEISSLRKDFFVIYWAMMNLYSRDEALRVGANYTIADKNLFDADFALLLQKHGNLRLRAHKIVHICSVRYGRGASFSMLCLQNKDLQKICAWVKMDRKFLLVKIQEQERLLRQEIALKRISDAKFLDRIAAQGVPCAPISLGIEELQEMVLSFVKPISSVLDLINDVLDPAIKVDVAI